MAKDEQILIRAESETKAEWESEADERGLSLTGFVRLAVENEIDGRDANQTADVPEVDELTDTVENVDERTESIQHQLQTVADALVDVRQEIEGETSDIEQQQVIEHLPEKSEVMRDDTIDPQLVPSARSIAKQIDHENPPTKAVERTLQQMALRSGRVKTGEHPHDGTKGYYIDV